MSGPFHTVLLCAEDDDLELIQVVHRGRQRGVELEVVPGVDLDDAPLREVLRSAQRVLFVVVRSNNLSLDRVKELKTVFASAKTAEHHLLALRLDPGRADASVDAIVRRLQQLGWTEDDSRPTGRSATPSPLPRDDSVKPLDPSYTPMIGRAELEEAGFSAEIDVTEKQKIRSEGEEETARSLVHAYQSSVTEPVRGGGRRLMRTLLSLLVLGALAGGGFVAYQQGLFGLVSPDATTPVQSIAPPSDATPWHEDAARRVPLEREADSAESRRLHRRATRRSGD
jgi:hypothetical protein